MHKFASGDLASQSTDCIQYSHRHSAYLYYQVLTQEARGSRGVSVNPLNTLVGMTVGVGYFVKGVEPPQIQPC